MQSQEIPDASAKRQVPDELTVRLANEHDEERMLEVLVSAFDGWPNFPTPVEPIEHLRWKIGPYDEAMPRLPVVAELGSQIACVRLDTSRRVWVAGKPRTLVMHANIATHRDFQRLGIYSKLRSHPVAQHSDVADFYFGWTFNPAVVQIAKQDDREPIRNKVLIKVLDRSRMIQNSTSSSSLRRNPFIRAAAIRSTDILSLFRRRVEDHRFDGEIRTVERFDERFDDLWQESIASFDYIGERSCAFLNWRYGDVRAGYCSVYAAFEDEHLEGYIALQENNGRGQILDILTRPSRQDVAGALIQEATRHFSERDQYIVECRMAAGNRYEQSLVDRGFFDAHKASNFYYLNRRLSDAELAVFSNEDAVIHIMQGDI